MHWSPYYAPDPGIMISVSELHTPCAAPPESYLPACDAFAHWAYFWTGGRIMVTDVQV